MRLISRNKLLTLLSLTILHISFGKSDPKLMLFDAQDINNSTKEITITFIVPEKDFIYKDFITCSAYEPIITLSPWKANKQSVNHYDPSFKETKPVFNETFSITLQATLNQCCSEPLHIYYSYYRKSDKKINDGLFTFSFAQPVETNLQIYDAIIESSQNIHHHRKDPRHAIFSSLNRCYFTVTNEMDHIVTFFNHYHLELFSLLLILMSLLFVLFYFTQDALLRHTKIYELLEMITSLMVLTAIIGGLWYLYTFDTGLNQMFATGISVIFSINAGFFYLKKSTDVSLGFLRTFYTFTGMICMSCVLLLLFKTIQYADLYLNLFP